MIAIPLLLAPGAFVAGIYFAGRLAPPLADTRTGMFAGRVVGLLAGAAAAVIALNAFLAFRAATAEEYSGFSRADSVAVQVGDALWQGGLLLAAAVAVHLLAPPPDVESDRAEIQTDR